MYEILAHDVDASLGAHCENWLPNQTGNAARPLKSLDDSPKCVASRNGLRVGDREVKNKFPPNLFVLLSGTAHDPQLHLGKGRIKSLITRERDSSYKIRG